MPVTRRDPDQWTDPRHRDGLEGEEFAALWLQQRGWQVVAHRWRLGRHDLDLIARQGALVAFIEVKTRRSNACGSGEEAVVSNKRRTLERVAWSWIVQHGQVGDQYRFDVITVRPGRNGWHARAIEDAWRPGWR